MLNVEERESGHSPLCLYAFYIAPLEDVGVYEGGKDDEFSMWKAHLYKP